jgi:hypothetical protein
VVRLDAVRRAVMRCATVETHLLHNTSFALGESNVSPRFILDELDLNLASLASWLVIIIVVVVGLARSRTLDAAVLSALDSVAIANGVVVARRGMLIVFGEFAGHGVVLVKICRVESRIMDGLGTVFDLNCLRSSAGFVWGLPFWRRAARRAEKAKAIGRRATNL